MSHSLLTLMKGALMKGALLAKRLRSLTAFVLFATLAGAAVAAPQVGDMAPDFELPGSDGVTYRLSDLRGERAVVVAWFPKAYTSGCTIECKSLAENGDKIRAFDVAYFMASVDPLADNVGFALDQGADFPLLSDPEKSTAKAYGVLSSAGYAKRYTFYIGVDGRILAIDQNVKPATSAEDMVAKLKALGVASAVDWSAASSGGH